MPQTQAHTLIKFAVTLLDTEYTIPLTYHVNAENKTKAEAIAITHACREQGIPPETSHPFKVMRVSQEPSHATQ